MLRFVAARRANACVMPLTRLLRTESRRTASLVAELLVGLEPPIRPLLKALGRHRHSPLEEAIAPLAWTLGQPEGLWAEAPSFVWTGSLKVWPASLKVWPGIP